MHVLALTIVLAISHLAVQVKPPAQAKPNQSSPLRPGQYTWHPERSSEGPVVIIVSIPDQKAYVYRNGIRIGQTTVSTGRAGHGTPTGVFTILQKDVNHHSSKYNNAPMPYMERLTWDGIALHAGNLPGYPASHGCVRLPLAFAKQLYGVTAMSTTVVVANKQTASEETLRPGLVLASANLAKTPGGVELPEPMGSFDWQPEKSETGPISLLLSGGDRTVYVYRNGVLIGRAGMSIADPDKPLVPGVFVMLTGTSDQPNPWVPNQPMPRWQSVGLPSADGQTRKSDVVERVRLPAEFAAKVNAILVPGTSVMVTDGRATADTSPGTNMTVLATGDAPAK